MKFASDFRRIARDALCGRWVLATFAAFIAGLIGAGSSFSSGGIDFEYRTEELPEALNGSIAEFVLKYGQIIVTVVSVLAIVYFIIGGAALLGYTKFNLKLVDHSDARIGDLFSQFNRIGTGIIMQLLMSLYLTLWSLLFVIPGIVKGFSYSMTRYIMAEHPEYDVNYAITESRRIMDGNKFRLFCLRLSFIGWYILCGVITGIGFAGLLGGVPLLGLLIVVSLVGSYAVVAYAEAAEAAFYREVSGTEFTNYTNYVNPEE